MPSATVSLLDGSVCDAPPFTEQVIDTGESTPGGLKVTNACRGGEQGGDDRREPGVPSGPSLVSKSWLDEAVSRAVGEDRHRIVTPASDVPIPIGFLPALGHVSYTD